jgi:signal recognition particle receptor subunit beta
MVLFNYSTRELTAKIVYYGPGLCGKTTNLQFVHENLPGDVRGKMLSLATKTDRTLFFDFLPIDLGEIRGMKTRVQLYTVPGQVFYNETRKLVLKGADGIVFVADSQETMLGANVESFKNLDENLKAHGMKLGEMPHVIQFNKRDLPKLSSIEDLNAALNKFNAPFYESVATSGIGVQDTLKAIVKLVLLNLTKKYDPKSVPAMTGTSPSASVAVPAMPKPAAAAAPAPKPAPSPAPARPAAPPVAAAPAPPAVSVSLSTVQPPAPVVKTAPAPAAFARIPAPAETMPPFKEDEIDGLMDEVGDMDVPPKPLQADVPAPMPAVAAMAAPAEEDGIWLGAPEDEEGSAFADAGMAFGSTTALEDMMADQEATAPKVSAPPETSWREGASFGSSFEIDRGFDPEFATPEVKSVPPRPAAMSPRPAPPAPVSDDRPIAPFPFPTGDDSSEDVVLTDVASGEDLFNDPTLEVARLAEGGAREIIVPVQLGEGAQARRFKLAIRLRLDPVE